MTENCQFLSEVSNLVISFTMRHISWESRLSTSCQKGKLDDCAYFYSAISVFLY